MNIMNIMRKMKNLKDMMSSERYEPSMGIYEMFNYKHKM